jgi:hypothetical protein
MADARLAAQKTRRIRFGCSISISAGTLTMYEYVYEADNSQGGTSAIRPFGHSFRRESQ